MDKGWRKENREGGPSLPNCCHPTGKDAYWGGRRPRGNEMAVYSRGSVSKWSERSWGMISTRLDIPYLGWRSEERRGSPWNLAWDGENKDRLHGHSMHEGNP